MSSEEPHQTNGIIQESTATSTNVPTADNNANVSGNVDHSKGAIPKTKSTTKNSEVIPKKHMKLNNNVEEMPTLNGIVSAKDLLRIHGYKKNTPECNSYRDRHDKYNIENTTLLTTTCSDNECTNSSLPEPDLNIQTECNLSNALDYLTLQEGPSNYHKVRLKFDYDSSSDENELLSVSDDGCIYTYKGDHVADLPSSFFSLDIPFVENPEQNDIPTRNSSPEMDFLEMDFDPGPSGDADSDSNSHTDMIGVDNLPEDVKENSPEPSCSYNITTYKPKNGSDLKSKPDNNQPPPDYNIAGPSTSHSNNIVKQNILVGNACKNDSNKLNSDNIKMPWSCTISQRTTSNFSPRTIKRYHCSTGELVSPNEKDSPVGDTHNNMLHSGINEKINNAVFKPLLESEDKIMVWTEQEALVKQITQIGASACGATAVLNVLTALRFPVPSIEKIQEAVTTRLRSNNSPLTEYLLSRSVAGSTHEDLISGLHKISNGQVYARFFPLYPERIVNLYMWLGFWIQNGAVPIATLNLQKCVGIIPDAWHHQMIFGVNPDRVYLTNPLELVDSGHLWPQLCSESVLLIRREDVLSRWNIKSDLKKLMAISDYRWRKLNVVGQVANMVRESMREFRPGFTNTSHIRIPAAYSSGITLAINVNSPACSLLSQCPELPLLYPSDTATALYNKIRMNK